MNKFYMEKNQQLKSEVMGEEESGCEGFVGLN